jgi:hypothetical protein
VTRVTYTTFPKIIASAACLKLVSEGYAFKTATILPVFVILLWARRVRKTEEDNHTDDDASR